MATIKDVAQRANVSAMTVSRVVHNDPGVTEENRAKVLKAMEELAYQPNRSPRGTGGFRSSGAQTTKTIGLLVDNIADPFMAKFASVVEDKARKQGYLVLMGCSQNDYERERETLRAFVLRRVEGLVVIPVHGDHSYLNQYLTKGLQIVCADRPAEGLDVDTVTVNNREASRQAVEHLINRGHRRIAYLGDNTEIYTVERRYHGYRDALHAAGIPLDPAIVKDGLRRIEAAESAAKEVFALPDPPTAVFASNDVVAIGVAEHLPENVAMASFDDFPFAAQLDPPIAVITQDPELIAEWAVTRLFERIGGDRSKPKHIQLVADFTPNTHPKTIGPYADPEAADEHS